MITALRLQNFKCFEDITLNLGQLTLMAGTNASGKSSVIQALLLLRQSHLRGLLPRGEILLNGSLAGLGTARDVLYENATSNALSITLSETGQGETVYSFLVQPGMKDVYRLRSEVPISYNSASPLFLPTFNYLNAERIGPRLTYPMAELRDESIDVGPQGQYALDVLSRHRDEPVAAPELIYRYQEEAEGGALSETSSDRATPIPKALEHQVRYWMQLVIPNFDFVLETISAADELRVGFRVGTQSYLRPTNIGFGLIYTLPIIVAALVAPVGSLLIVENPEAHLHPAGQSRMGRFLARVAASGIQVIVETHSDHVLNGIRRAVRDKVLKPNDAALAFFTGGDDGAARVIQPKIYASGGIRPWPKGFFDQFERDLRELL